MAKLKVTDRSGQEHDVEGDSFEGLSVMEIIRDSGVEEIAALCGGCCSCSTCHVYVEASFVDTLPPQGRDEADLLEASSHRTDLSRLSCQIQFNSGMDGLKVTVAPED